MAASVSLAAFEGLDPHAEVAEVAADTAEILTQRSPRSPRTRDVTVLDCIPGAAMSVIFQHDEVEIWNPASRVARLFMSHVAGLEAVVGAPSGLSAGNSDEVDVQADLLGVFLTALAATLEHTHHRALLALATPTIAILAALYERCDPPVPCPRALEASWNRAARSCGDRRGWPSRMTRINSIDTIPAPGSTGPETSRLDSEGVECDSRRSQAGLNATLVASPARQHAKDGVPSFTDRSAPGQESHSTASDSDDGRIRPPLTSPDRRPPTRSTSVNPVLLRELVCTRSSPTPFCEAVDTGTEMGDQALA